MHRGDLVHEVVGVCDAGVKAQAACRREGMCSVADSFVALLVDGCRLKGGDIQEDILLPVLFCDFAAEEPWPVAQDIERNVLANCCFESRPTEILVPGLGWMLLRLRNALEMSSQRSSGNLHQSC